MAKTRKRARSLSATGAQSAAQKPVAWCRSAGGPAPPKSSSAISGPSAERRSRSRRTPFSTARILAARPRRVQPAAPIRYPARVTRSPDRHDELLRERLRANLARFERRALGAEGLRAVAVALLPDAQARPCFLITRRASGLRSHGGQWALPGGRLDPGESPQQAALRELEEEVGLALEGEGV